jgi:hypothetical protein
VHLFLFPAFFDSRPAHAHCGDAAFACLMLPPPPSPPPVFEVDVDAATHVFKMDADRTFKSVARRVHPVLH